MTFAPRPVHCGTICSLAPTRLRSLGGRGTTCAAGATARHRLAPSAPKMNNSPPGSPTTDPEPVVRDAAAETTGSSVLRGSFWNVAQHDPAAALRADHVGGRRPLPRPGRHGPAELHRLHLAIRHLAVRRRHRLDPDALRRRDARRRPAGGGPRPRLLGLGHRRDRRRDRHRRDDRDRPARRDPRGGLDPRRDRMWPRHPAVDPQCRTGRCPGVAAGVDGRARSPARSRCRW